MVPPNDPLRPTNSRQPSVQTNTETTSFWGRAWSSAKRWSNQVSQAWSDLVNKHILHKPIDGKDKPNTRKKWAEVNLNAPRDHITGPEEQVKQKMNQVLIYIKRHYPEQANTTRKKDPRTQNSNIPIDPEQNRTTERTDINARILENAKLIKDLEPYKDEEAILSGHINVNGIRSEEGSKENDSLLSALLKVLEERYPGKRSLRGYSEEHLKSDVVSFIRENLYKEPFKTELHRLIEHEIENYNSNIEGVETIKNDFSAKRQTINQEFAERIREIQKRARQGDLEPKEENIFIKTLEYSKKSTLEKLQKEENQAVREFRAAQDPINTSEEYLYKLMNEDLPCGDLHLYCLSYAYGIKIDVYNQQALKKDARLNKRFENSVKRFNPQSQSDPINLLLVKGNEYRVISEYDPSAPSLQEALITSLQEPILPSSNKIQEFPADKNDVFYALALGLKKNYGDDTEIQEELNWNIQPDEANKLNGNLKNEIAFLRQPGQHIKNQITDYLEEMIRKNDRSNPLFNNIRIDIQSHNEANAIAVNEAQVKLNQMKSDSSISQNLIDRQENVITDLKRKKINSPTEYLHAFKKNDLRGGEDTYLKIFSQMYKVPVLTWKPWFSTPDLSETKFNNENAPTMSGKKIAIKKIKGQSYMPVLIGKEFNHQPPLQLLMNNRRMFQFINNP